MFPRWRGYEPLEQSTSPQQSKSPSLYLHEGANYVLHRLVSVPRNISWLVRRSPWVRQPKINVTDPPLFCQTVPAASKLRRFLRRFCVLLAILPQILFLILVFCALFFPSYTLVPARYQDLTERSSNSSIPGRANPSNEKVFIATTIYEPTGELTGGAWGDALLKLIDLLGPEHVFLSLYENDPTPSAAASLDVFQQRVQCNASVKAEHVDIKELPKVTLPSGEERVRRIAFLAEVRNRALLPLDDRASPASQITFDKLLYLNDVIFDPTDAAQLLFSTNAEATGQADYRAACAVDFINPFKFYDTYATRDLEGYPIGLPFFPWFSSNGDAGSRHDVLAQKDAVRVRSCWGGMVAFDAKWFQQPQQHSASLFSTATSSNTKPLRFTYDHELYWDSSECCLIHARLQTFSPILPSDDTGIYINPYVRVSYDETTFRWLPLVRRVERTFSLIHAILTYTIGVRTNYRRTEEPGDVVWHYDWQSNNTIIEDTDSEMPQGSWQLAQTTAGVGGYCGIEQMLVLGDGQEGHARWERAPFPPRPVQTAISVL
ncbi:MAG: hypothetical protein M1821_006978 [Bathelium mastoideum]|nr:MAG: hypothetical protein M1821_006978 [Bathelium mastoideum]